jgi:predicted RNase H-like HicB family nuclease
MDADEVEGFSFGFPDSPVAGGGDAGTNCVAKGGSLARILNMKREYSVVIEKDSEGYLVASVPQLPGCHTQAKSFDQLMDRIKEAIELCLEEYGDTQVPNEFMGIQKVLIEV